MNKRIMKVFIRSAFSVTVLAFLAVGADAQQVRASQKAAVSQRVANTDIAIEYSRPSAKGRVLFGEKGIVKYSEVWMPGANEASNIKFSRDVLLNGQPLKAGRYSFWVIPEEKKWTVILSTDWDQWHTSYPGRDEDALRFDIDTKVGSHKEMLTFYFPQVTANSAVINLHWGTVIIPFEIRLAETD